jgi:hypothetical protein
MLRATNLVGFGIGGRTAIDHSYRNFYQNSANSSSYTFTSADIGVAAPDRWVIVTLHGRTGSSGTYTCDTCTVGGNATTRILNISGQTANGNIIAMFCTNAPIASGETANIVCSWNAAVLNCSIGVFAAYGLRQATPDASITANTQSAPSGSISVRPGGLLVAHLTDIGSTTCTWTGPTERYDTTVEAEIRSGASLNTTTTGNTTVTATPAAQSGFGHMLAASWWP